MKLKALTITSVLAFAGSIALAQPNVVDKRRKKKGPNVSDKRDRKAPGIRAAGPVVRGFTPQKGPVGTVVTIRGNRFPPGVMVQVGGQRVKPTSNTPRKVTFKIPPRVRPGTRRITLTWGGRGRKGVGRFEVGPAAADNVVDKRDVEPADSDVAPNRRPEPHVRREVRRRWHRDRPIVTRFFPRKGSVGTKVTIRGRNFAPDAQVMLGRRPVKAKVGKRRITFKIPKGPKGELIRVKSGRRTIPVGRFELVDKYNYEAERRKLEAARRAEAEAAWNARKGKLAKDRKARRRAYEARQAELARTRAERRRARIVKMRKRWKRAFLRDSETRAELALHAERVARLARMRRLAELNDSGKLVVRIEIAIRVEDGRHDRRMASLKASFGVN